MLFQRILIMGPRIYKQKMGEIDVLHAVISHFPTNAPYTLAQAFKSMKTMLWHLIFHVLHEPDPVCGLSE